MPFDDATLIDASRHALYDRHQLLSVAALLATGNVPRVLGDRVEFHGVRMIVLPSDAFGVAQASQNALIESGAIRARCLYEFFYRAPHPRYVRASDFFTNGEAEWCACRDSTVIPHAAVFAEVWGRASALAAHVGPERVSLHRADAATWDLQPIAVAAECAWQRFIANAPPGRLHTDVQESRR